MFLFKKNMSKLTNIDLKQTHSFTTSKNCKKDADESLNNETITFYQPIPLSPKVFKTRGRSRSRTCTNSASNNCSSTYFRNPRHRISLSGGSASVGGGSGNNTSFSISLSQPSSHRSVRSVILDSDSTETLYEPESSSVVIGYLDEFPPPPPPITNGYHSHNHHHAHQSNGRVSGAAHHSSNHNSAGRPSSAVYGPIPLNHPLESTNHRPSPLSHRKSSSSPAYNYSSSVSCNNQRVPADYQRQGVPSGITDNFSFPPFQSSMELSKRSSGGGSQKMSLNECLNGSDSGDPRISHFASNGDHIRHDHDEDPARDAITFSVDLVMVARELVRFLRMVNQAVPALHQQDIVINAIRRYETYWLPLLAKSDSTSFIPPVDVEWVWQAHMMSPSAYKVDCLKILGKIPDHQLHTKTEIEAVYERSVLEWEAYCGAKEPYEFWASLRQRQHTSTDASGGFRSKLRANIEYLIHEQQAFAQHVTLPHFGSIKFLTQAANRYRHWLYLLHLHPTANLVPIAPDIVLMMRCHALYPQEFIMDTSGLLGKVLDLPSVKQCLSAAAFHAQNSCENGENLGATGSRSPDPLSGSSGNNLEALWDATYAPRMSFWKSGCAFTDQEIVHNQLEYQEIANINYGQLHVQAIYLTELPMRKGHIKLRLNYGKNRLISLDELDASIFDTHDQQTLKFQNIDGSKPIIIFRFDRRTPKMFFLDLETFDKAMLGNKTSLSSWHACIELEDLLPERSNESNQRFALVPLRPKAEINKAPDTDLSFAATIQTFIAVNREFVLVRKEFQEEQITVDHPLFQLCHFAALDKAALQFRSSVVSAKHSLMDSVDGTEYTIQIVHSVHALLSMVLVFRGSALLAIAHLANTDSVPFEEDIETPFCPALNSSKERIMMIRNKSSYFGAVKAQCSINTSIMAAEDELVGSDITFYNLAKRKMETMLLPDPSGSTKFTVGGATAKLAGKSIQIESLDVAEHLAAVFSTSVLFLLCVSKSASSACVTMRPPSFVRAAGKWPLVLAAGFGHQHPICQELTSAPLAGNLGGGASDVTNNQLVMIVPQPRNEPSYRGESDEGEGGEEADPPYMVYSNARYTNVATTETIRMKMM